MARIKFTAIVDEIRGSIGGTTFQGNAYGYTVKAKPNMINPMSSDQNRVKNAMSKVTRTWRDMSNAERTAYATFAAAYPQYAKHNPTAVLSGYAVFLRYNFLRAFMGKTLLESFSGSPPTEDTLTYIIDSTSGTLRIYIDSTTESEYWDIIFFMSRPFAPSQNYIGTKPKYVDHDVNYSGNTDITTVYTNKFGSIPSSGDRVAMDALVLADSVPYVLARDSDVYTVATGT